MCAFNDGLRLAERFEAMSVRTKKKVPPMIVKINKIQNDGVKINCILSLYTLRLCSNCC